MTELKKILHVDDDPDIRTITKIALEDVGGFDVVQCSGGQEALATIGDVMPDLLLIDYMMPDVDGEQTYRELRKSDDFRDLPVIFVTAKAQESLADNLRAMGVLEVITKPFDPISLSDEIRAIWAERDTLMAKRGDAA